MVVARPFFFSDLVALSHPSFFLPPPLHFSPSRAPPSHKKQKQMTVEVAEYVPANSPPGTSPLRVAVKRLRKGSALDAVDLAHEARVLRGLSHRYITKYIGVGASQSTRGKEEKREVVLVVSRGRGERVCVCVCLGGGSSFLSGPLFRTLATQKPSFPFPLSTFTIDTNTNANKISKRRRPADRRALLHSPGLRRRRDPQARRRGADGGDEGEPGAAVAAG